MRVLTVDMERPREALLALVLEVNANELRAKDAAAKALSDKRLELEGMSNKEANHWLRSAWDAWMQREEL